MQEFSEAIVDRALVELLTCSAAFREWFLATAAPDAPAPYRDLTFRGATRSVSQGNGESDVVAEWRTPADESILILVEDKLTAGFQKHQGKRYAVRAAQLVADGTAASVRTVLLAPAHYLQAANPEAMEFEVRISLEDLVAAAVRAQPDHEHVLLLRLTLKRVQEGGALGAKGLHMTTHTAIAAECDRRDNGFRITNNATDWVFFDHPERVTGLTIRYRISKGIAELALKPGLKDDRDRLVSGLVPPFLTAASGGYKFVRVPELNTSREKGTFTPSDAEKVADALERLMGWWVEARAVASL